MFPFRKKKRPPVDSLESIHEDTELARTLKAEAVRVKSATASVAPGIIEVAVARRTLDPFGEQVQVTFTRKTA